MTDEKGRAFVFGDDIDTDVLAPGIYMKQPLEALARHCLEAVDPNFAASIRPGDVVVAGRNFGIGSSREQAVEALKFLGVGAIVAISFGGIFYRNALNLGLLALVCPQAGRIQAGDRLAVDGVAGVVENLTRRERYEAEPIPEHLMRMVAAGGLVAYLEGKLKGAAADR